ncbi:hypothetical protein JN853_08460 [Pseudomonas syringae pv. actinidiae ICMP 9853]|nr:hypothetical protein JN853_08460 [Pseudomonas syringae pv. actinidiae ICMP 9853]
MRNYRIGVDHAGRTTLSFVWGWLSGAVGGGESSLPRSGKDFLITLASIYAVAALKSHSPAASAAA